MVLKGGVGFGIGVRLRRGLKKRLGRVVEGLSGNVFIVVFLFVIIIAVVVVVVAREDI